MGMLGIWTIAQKSPGLYKGFRVQSLGFRV